MADYTAWLIEINDSATSGPFYFKFEHDDDWTKDHDRACHFSRKQDADQVIEHYGWTRAKAVEHMWPELTVSDVIASRRPPTNASSYPVSTSHLEREQMKHPRKPR